MSDILDEELNAVSVLKDGGVILCPTDIVWGLSCDAYNEGAVKKIYKIKGRDINKTMPLIVDSIDHLKQYIINIHPRIETLIHYHRRPITVIYKANEKLPSYLSDENGTVAIRVTNDPSLCTIIKEIKRPVISTSAALSGTPNPKNYEDISSYIKNQVDYTLYPDRTTEYGSQATMLISYDEEGELIFLRK